MNDPQPLLSVLSSSGLPIKHFYFTYEIMQCLNLNPKLLLCFSFKFIDFELSDEDTCRATVRMFLQCNLVEQFHIPYNVSNSILLLMKCFRRFLNLLCTLKTVSLFKFMMFLLDYILNLFLNSSLYDTIKNIPFWYKLFFIK